MSWYSICFLCVCVGHDSEPCRNGWTYWDAVWETQGTPCIRWDPDLTQEFEDDILEHVWRSIYSNCSHHRTCVHQAAKLVAALLRVAGVTAGLAECNGKNRDLLQNPMLGILGYLFAVQVDYDTFILTVWSCSACSLCQSYTVVMWYILLYVVIVGNCHSL